MDSIARALRRGSPQRRASAPGPGPCAHLLVAVIVAAGLAPGTASAQAPSMDVELRFGYDEFMRSAHLQPGPSFHLSMGDGSRSGFGIRLGISAKLGPREADDCVGVDPLECERVGTTLDTAAFHLESRFTFGEEARLRPFVGGRIGYERMFNGWNIGGGGLSATGGVEIGLTPRLAILTTGTFGYVTYQPPTPFAQVDFDGMRATLDAGLRWTRRPRER